MENKKINLEDINQDLLDFFEALLEKKGMNKLPADLLADMIMDLYGRFNAFILVSVMGKMDPENYKKFDEFIETDPTPEQSQKFMEENVPNLPEVTKEAMADFSQVYLGNQNNQ